MAGPGHPRMLDSSPGGPELASRVHVFASRARTMTLRSGTRIEVIRCGTYPVAGRPPPGAPLRLRHPGDRGPAWVVDWYIDRNREITALVARPRLARPPAGMAVLSSGGRVLGDDLDTNPYGVLKARTSDLPRALQVDRRRRSPRPGSRAQRLFNLAGPFLNKPDHLVLGSIIRDIPGRTRSASGPTSRWCVPTSTSGDLVELSWRPCSGIQPLPDMASTRRANGRSRWANWPSWPHRSWGDPDWPSSDRPSTPPRPDRYVGDPSAMRAMARRPRHRDAAVYRQQIEDTADFMMGRPPPAGTATARCYEVLQGASPLSHNSSRRWSSRKVSTGCQKPWWR